MDDSYRQNNSRGYISFAAPDRELRKIPATLPFLLMPMTTIYTVCRMQRIFCTWSIRRIHHAAGLPDCSFSNQLWCRHHGLLLQPGRIYQREISLLKTKNNGGHRLIIAYMSIGEAEDYRYYWNADWNTDPPPGWKMKIRTGRENYKVAYWDEGWQSIIYGSTEAYLDKIMKKDLMAFTWISSMRLSILNEEPLNHL